MSNNQPISVLVDGIEYVPKEGAIRMSVDEFIRDGRIDVIRDAAPPQRDWKILSVLADGGSVIRCPSDEIVQLCIKKGGERTHSVKRLSDGEVFSVGDDAFSEVWVGSSPQKIKGFTIVGGDMVAIFNTFRTPLNKIRKPTRQPLFTTEDGGPVYRGDEYWWVDKQYFELESDIADNGSGSLPNSYKYFRTKAAAEAYIAEHKPMYSIADVKEAVNGTGVISHSDLIERLKKLKK